MNEFSPPTLKHLCVFIIVFGAGFAYIFYYEMYLKKDFSLNQLLDNTVSILVVSAMLTAVLVEGSQMFYEAYEKRRKEEGRQEGRQEGLQEGWQKGRQEVIEQMQELAEKHPLTKEDIQRLTKTG